MNSDLDSTALTTEEVSFCKDRGLQYPSAQKIAFSDQVLIYWLNLSYFEKQQ